jgi:hypothetical protein
VVSKNRAVLLHTLTNGQYGFRRDELATLDDTRYLAWGYVAYPPVTPFIGRMALELFGPSPRWRPVGPACCAGTPVARWPVTSRTATGS